MNSTPVSTCAPASGGPCSLTFGNNSNLHTMQKKITIDIYRSNIIPKKYLSVPHGTDVTKFPFPAGFDPDLRQLCPFKSDREITSGVPLVALDSDDVIRQIEEKGYATHATDVVISMSVDTK